MGKIPGQIGKIQENQESRKKDEKDKKVESRSGSPRIEPLPHLSALDLLSWNLPRQTMFLDKFPPSPQSSIPPKRKFLIFSCRLAVRECLRLMSCESRPRNNTGLLA